MNKRIERVKKHVSENLRLYLGASIILVGVTGLIVSKNPGKVTKVAPYIQQFLKNHPQHVGEALRYTVVDKGQHLISMPIELMAQYNVGEKYDVVLTSSPVIYGPSLIIANELGKHLAVFPLLKGKL